MVERGFNRFKPGSAPSLGDLGQASLSLSLLCVDQVEMIELFEYLKCYPNSCHNSCQSTMEGKAGQVRDTQVKAKDACFNNEGLIITYI